MKSRSQLPAKSVIVVDAAAMVWTLDWPSRGKAKVHDLMNLMNRTVGYSGRITMYMLFLSDITSLAPRHKHV